MPGSDEDEAGRRPSSAERSVAAAAGALVGVGFGPVGVVAGAALAPYLEELAQWAWDQFRPDAHRRQARMLASGIEVSGRDDKGFAALIGESERSRLLTATAMSAAARTAWPPKVSALGRALADGLIAEDAAEINVADLVVPAMADMERPHLSLLELLVRWVPVESAGRPLRVRAYGGGGGQRGWTVRQIGEARATLRPVLTSLIGTLDRHGLAEQEDSTAQVLAAYSAQMRDETMRTGIRAGQTITPQSLLPPEVSELQTRDIVPEPAWLPTELGERVLGYYELAAESNAGPPSGD